MLVPLIALIGQMALPPLSPAESIEDLPVWLVQRWKCSDVEQTGWETPGFDDDAWGSPRLIPMFDNGMIEDHRGGTWPEPAGIQYAFQSFWHHTNQDLNRKTFYRRDFMIPESFGDCSTYLTVDDTYEMYVNGVRVAQGRDDLIHRTREFPIGQLLHQGKNVVAISAINRGATMEVRNWTDLHLSFPVRAIYPNPWRCTRSFQPHWSEPQSLTSQTYVESLSDRRPGSPTSRGWVTPIRLNSEEAVRTNIASDPMWIDRDWGHQETVFFRMPLYLDGVPNFGNLQISADNAWEVWVNGKLTGQYRAEQPDHVETVDISSVLHRGMNVIGVKAMNFGGPASLTVLPTIKLSL